jgi:hypothetical protein
VTVEQRINELFVQLADTLVQDYALVDFMDTLVQGCLNVLPVDALGVMLADSSGGLSLTAASSESMRVLEVFEAQERTGPCFAAYVSGEQVVVESLRTAEGRWPEFVKRALEDGFRAAYAFPLRLRGDTIGALNLFSETEVELGAQRMHLGQSLADVATIGILQERAVHDAEVRAKQLQGALDSRVLIEQTKGVLTERLDVEPQEAFERVRAYARSHNQLLHRVCQRVLDGELQLD